MQSAIALSYSRFWLQMRPRYECAQASSGASRMASSKSAIALSNRFRSCQAKPRSLYPSAALLVDPDRPGVIGDGLIEPILLAPRKTAVQIGVSVTGIEPDGGCEVFNGHVVFRFRAPNAPRHRYASAISGSSRMAAVKSATALSGCSS